MKGLKMQRKPIPLRPSAPASTHQLSYNQFANERIKQQLKISDHSKLLKQIEAMHAAIYERDSVLKQTKQLHLKQILMLQIQIQHQIEVTSKYDSELRKCESSRNQLQNFYEMKLELIKKEMTEAFQSEIAQEREKTYEELRLIKQNYCTKIGLIGEGNKERQFDFSKKQEKFSNYQLKLNLISTKLQQKERLISDQNEKLIRLQQEKNEREREIRKLYQKAQQNDNQSNKGYDSLKKKLVQAENLKQQIYERFKATKSDLERTEFKNLQLQRTVLSLRDQLESALRRYNYIQKQFDELNRKTFKNKDEYDKNPVARRMESERQTQNREREKDKDKDKQNMAKFAQQVAKLQKQNQMLRNLLKEKEEEARNLSELLRQKQREVQALEKEAHEKNRKQGSSKGKFQQLEKQYLYIKEELKTKDRRIRQVQSLLNNQAEQFVKKLQFLVEKEQRVSHQNQDQQKEVKAISQKIEAFYLKEIQAQKKKIQGLQLTLNQTQQMMVNLAKEKKDLQIQFAQFKEKSGKKK